MCPGINLGSKPSTKEAFSPFPSPEAGFQERAEKNGRQLVVGEAAARPLFSPTQKCVVMTLATLFAGFALLGDLLVVCICVAGAGFVLVEAAISLKKGYHNS